MKKPKRSSTAEKIDKTDINILSELIADAKKPYTEIAEKLSVSGGTVHVRMGKLEEAGIVKGATLQVDFQRLGYDIQAFLGIYLEKSSYYTQVAEALMQIPEVLRLHYTTGQYSIFIEVLCRDTQHLRELIHDKVQHIDGISRTDTMISLEEKSKKPLNLLQSVSPDASGTVH